MGDCPPSDTATRAEAAEGFYSALLDDDAEALYERAPCGYVSTTPDGTIVKVNQTFLTWSGYQRGDLIGRRTFAELLTAGGRIYHETHYAPMLRMQDKVREIALDIVGGDGQRLPALVNSVLERDTNGAPVVIRTAIFDATERRRYERELLLAKLRAEESEAHATLLAKTLQHLIPPAAPDVPGLDLAATYRPAGSGEEVGGDFYDVFEIAAGDWVVAVGDVCGKGVDAAVVTAVARHTIRWRRGRQSRSVESPRLAQQGAARSRDRPVLHGRPPAVAPIGRLVDCDDQPGRPSDPLARSRRPGADTARSAGFAPRPLPRSRSSRHRCCPGAR